MSKVKIGLIQYGPEILKFEANLEKGLNLSKQAVDFGAQILCLPETMLFGYDTAVIKESVSKIKDYFADARDRCAEFAKKENVFVIAPICNYDEAEDKTYNSVYVITNKGEVAGCVEKLHLWLAGQNAFDVSNRESQVFTTEWGKFSVCICFDLAHPELIRLHALMGAEVLFCTSAWRRSYSDQLRFMLQSRAAENGIYTVGVNVIAMYENTDLGGGSAVCDPHGDVIAACSTKREEVRVCEIDMDFLRNIRKTTDPYLALRRPEMYKGLL